MAKKTIGFITIMARQKIIIGIHGLGNKPPQILLEEWWRLAIHEGLTRIGCPKNNVNFELVYWANILHKKLLDPDETDTNSDYFLDEKYQPSSENSKSPDSLKTSFLQKIYNRFNNILFNKKLHSNFPSVTDWVIKHFFKELDIYLSENCVTEENYDCLAKEVIREKLHSTLLKHQDKDILLIAHSMGTIIAFDVLSKYQHELSIKTFITCGSPLGVPFIFNRVKDELLLTGSDAAYTPNSIEQAWFNLADLNDKLAVNYELNQYFLPNKKEVAPQGMVVINDYQNNGINNPHKSFGYLRSKEMSEIIDKFIEEGKPVLIKWFVKYMRKLKMKLN